MASEEQPAPKSVLAKQKQKERIAAVNLWRGQCLDNFARAEYAIVRCSEELCPIATASPFKLEESASNRTRALCNAVKQNWPTVAKAGQLAGLLDLWMIREKERNDLVHGRFGIRAGLDCDWQLVNELLLVKKGVALSSRTTINAQQAAAFLEAIINERKRLELALEEFPQIASGKPA